MNRALRAAFLSAATCLMLTACGGGRDTDQQSADGDRDRAQVAAALAVPLSSQDTIYAVYRPEGSPDDKIAFATRGGLVKLYMANGVEATTLDDIPQALANVPWNKDAHAAGHLRLRFMPGTYRFKAGWTWPAGLSGKDAQRQIVMEKAYSLPGDVVLMGSERITTVYPSAGGVLSLPLSLPAPDQIWAEGQRAIRARTPNIGGYLFVKGEAPGWRVGTSVTDTINGQAVSMQAFQTYPADFARVAAVHHDPQAMIVLMDDWQVSRHRIAELDTAGQRIRLSNVTNRKVEYDRRQRYFIENTPSALDSPGEWYWAPNGTNGTLRYLPATTPPGNTLTLEIPRVDRLLTMTGAGLPANTGKPWIEHVQFSGLTFSHARVPPALEHTDAQAEASVMAAIELNNARHIVFDRCKVSHTGGYAIWLNQRVRSTTISSSELFDLGAGGIKVGKYRPHEANAEDHADLADPHATGANSIVGNRIHSVGHAYPGAVSIWIGRSSHNRVAENFITDTTYTAISVGWNWDAGVAMASNNLIEKNFIYKIGQRALSDIGGVYVLGRSTGTRITGNVIREVRDYHYGGHGIYADEGSSQLTVDGNIILSIDAQGYNQHWGEDNVVTNNVFADTEQMFGVFKRATINRVPSVKVPVRIHNNFFLPHTNDFEMIAPASRSMQDEAGDWVPVAPQLQDNMVSDQYLPTDATLSIAKRCTDCRANTALRLIDNGPLRVPRIDLFKGMAEGVNLPRSQHDAVLTKAASPIKLWVGNPDAAPAKIIDFRGSLWPLGYTEMLGWYVNANPAFLTNLQDTTVPVRIESDAGGTPFLALNDTARKTNTWEPFLQTTLDYEHGSTAKVAFTSRFDANADIVHEWRDDPSGDMSAGPSVRFVASGGHVKVLVNGVEQTILPLNTWVSVEMVSEIREGATWSMKIERTGAPVVLLKNLPPRTANWKFFGSMLFASMSNVKSTTGFAAIRAEKL